MFYNLASQIDKERFKTRCNALYKSGKTVELTEKSIKRSVQQNKYLHLILTWFAIETGNQTDYVKQNYFKVLCNKSTFVQIVDDEHLGTIEVVRSSAALDSAEMTTAIERFRNWSAEQGVYLPAPNEEDFLRHIAVEAERHKMYL